MLRLVIYPAIVVAGLLGSSGMSAAPDVESENVPVYATFEGRTIDLSTGWAPAQACVEADGLLTCYRSEAQLDLAHPELTASSPNGHARGDGAAPMAACSTSLRLYDGTNFATPMITLTTRQTVHNLSSYGFDNKTSSYRVGACSARLHNAANLGGPKYPGPTSANSSSGTMQTGWNNTISSAFLE